MLRDASPNSIRQNPAPADLDQRPASSRTRWTICAMLFAATSINYMDRQVLGILAPTLHHSLGWTEQQYGYIVSAFQAAYAIGLILAGRMVDRLGTRTGYALVMGLWSLAAMGHAMASSVFSFAVARFFLGLGESGNFPAAVKTTAEWFPQRERSLATGLFNSGANIGAIIAPFTVPWITLHYGWRAAFLATGAIGLFWIAWWATRYRSPQSDPHVSASELAHIQEQAPRTNAPHLTWRELLHYRQTWAFTVAKFLTDPIWYFYLFWLPKFLDGRFHLGLSRIGLPLILVYTLSSAGSIGGGFLPTLLTHPTRTIQRARVLAMLLCACLAVPVFLVGRTHSEWIAVSLLGLAAAAHQGWSANLFTTASDMFPQRTVGVVVGIGGMAGSIAGVLFAAATGRLLELTGSYNTLFIIAASAYLLALLVLTRLAPQLEPAPLAA